MNHVAVLPRLNDLLPKLGGVAKSCPADFEVEEIPAYAPSGQGDHLFIWLQKVGMPANALLSHVSRCLGVAQRDIGCAGLKDAQATTRQFISVPASVREALPKLQDDPRVTVLDSALHQNKLRTGHLRGNRFVMRVRNCHADGARRAGALVEALKTQGMPNYFGSQRFGRGGATLDIGMHLLRGAERAGARRGGAPRSMHRLALSSVQSSLFNTYVARRLRSKSLHTVLPGEVMQVRVSGGPFVAEDLEREQARFDAREIVGAGPMFGPKMKAAQDDVLALELELLQELGLGMAQFAAHKKLLQGTRRANLIFFDDLRVTFETDHSATVSVSLPSGSYATVLLEELGCALQASEVKAPDTPAQIEVSQAHQDEAV